MPHLYFAYGSNMSTTRLRARITGAEPIGAARIDGYLLRCNKRGKDGSGKANLVAAPVASTWGVLFALASRDWAELDRCEWGYDRLACEVTSAAGTAIAAQLYLARAPEPHEIAPFDWYREHCLEGAREHRLPGSVIEVIVGWTVELDRR